MKKRLLIAGGSHADIPVIQAAQKLGYYVITSGNNPHDAGHYFSDVQHYADYSSSKEMLLLAKELKIDAICPSSNDFSALSCAYVAENLGLPGHDDYFTTMLMHHKDRFRIFAQQYDIPVPKAWVYTDKERLSKIPADMHFPLLVKPVDLSGGKGMQKVENINELLSAIDYARTLSRQEKVVVENFLEGSNHGYSAFLKNGKIIFAFMDDEHYFLNPYLVSGASTSLQDTQDLRDKLNAILETLSSILSLTDGLLHVQFILHQEAPYIIEICRRTPGDLYLKLIEFSTGFSMAEAIVKSVAEEDVVVPNDLFLRYVTRHCVMAERTGNIAEVSYGIFKQKIFDRFKFYKVGDAIEDIMTYKAEIDFIQYTDRKEMEEMLPLLNQEIRIRYQK